MCVSNIMLLLPLSFNVNSYFKFEYVFFLLQFLMYFFALVLSLHWHIGLAIHCCCICFGITFFLDLRFMMFSDFQLQIDRGIMVLDKPFFTNYRFRSRSGEFPNLVWHRTVWANPSLSWRRSLVESRLSTFIRPPITSWQRRRQTS